MDAEKTASLETIRDALIAHVTRFHDAREGELVTDFVAVAGWVNPSDEEDGFHIVASPGTPGYTAHGLLADAVATQANATRLGENDEG